jgi:hypothetical protein
MATHELTKMIEAKKLNKRSKLPLTEPPVTIPFGALIQDIEEDGDLRRFSYLGELYQCPRDLLARALPRVKTAAAAPPEALPQRVAAQGVVVAAEAGAAIQWEELASSSPLRTWRAKVPGGWLLAAGGGGAAGLTFYPDVDHSWDGRTLG